MRVKGKALDLGIKNKHAGTGYEVMNCFWSLRLGSGTCEKKKILEQWLTANISQPCDIAAK